MEDHNVDLSLRVLVADEVTVVDKRFVVRIWNIWRQKKMSVEDVNK